MSLVPRASAGPSTLPPGPRRRWPGEHAVRLFRDPLGFLTRVAREHGDVASFRIGPQNMLLLSDPDTVRDVLVTHQRQFHKGRGLERAKRLLGEGMLTSEGEFHLRQRRLAQPAFHRARVAAYGETMAAYSARTAGRWHDGQRVDAAEEMTRLTLAIAAKTMFDADVEHEAAEIGEAITASVEAFSLGVLPFGELFDHLPLPRTRRFWRAKALLDRTIYRMIAERRASGEDRGDLLSMLLLATDGEGDSSGSGDRMSDEQLRDEAMTLLLAGHETTANALAWSWLLLAEHPAVEARLHREVDLLMATPGRAPDTLPGAADLARLPYTRAIVAESLRLYPPAWILGRRALEPYTVREWTVPAGTIVLMSQWVVHRDARHWPEPLRFDPDRWAPEAPGSATRPKFAYFPFGGGTRVCIGEQFAWMEATLALATIARDWRLRRAEGAAPVVPRATITLRPRGGIPMIVEARPRPRAPDSS